MGTIPLNVGPASRGRIGPFWIEEGLALVFTGALILAAVIALYVLAAVTNPS